MSYANYKQIYSSEIYIQKKKKRTRKIILKCNQKWQEIWRESHKSQRQIQKKKLKRNCKCEKKKKNSNNNSYNNKERWEYEGKYEGKKITIYKYVYIYAYMYIWDCKIRVREGVKNSCDRQRVKLFKNLLFFVAFVIGNPGHTKINMLLIWLWWVSCRKTKTFHPPCFLINPYI